MKASTVSLRIFKSRGMILRKGYTRNWLPYHIFNFAIIWVCRQNKNRNEFSSNTWEILAANSIRNVDEMNEYPLSALGDFRAVHDRTSIRCAYSIPLCIFCEPFGICTVLFSILSLGFLNTTILSRSGKRGCFAGVLRR